jgi:hypothetical protein
MQSHSVTNPSAPSCVPQLLRQEADIWMKPRRRFASLCHAEHSSTQIQDLLHTHSVSTRLIIYCTPKSEGRFFVNAGPKAKRTHVAICCDHVWVLQDGVLISGCFQLSGISLMGVTGGPLGERMDLAVSAHGSISEPGSFLESDVID